MSAGQGPADSGWDAEQLDAAIGQGTPPGLVTDPELARDLEIVAMLRSRRAAFDPHPSARGDSKQRLMAALLAAQAEDRAVAPAPAPHPAELTAPIPAATAPVVGASDETAVIGRIPADDADADEAAAVVEAPLARPGRAGRHSRPSRPGSRSRTRGTGSRSTTRPAASGLRRRFVAVGAAAMVALIALATVGNFASRDALPGDALYAMKRIAENTGLALTFDDQQRAQRHLELATIRLDEVEQLVSGSSSTTAADPVLVESAMNEFNASTGEGSRMLLGADDASGAAALGDLRAWAVEQAARLSVLRSSLPDPAVDEADTSIAMLDRLLARTEALEARSSCTEVTSSTVDDLGRLPAEGTCSPRGQLADDPTSATEDGPVATTTPDGSATTSPDGTTPQDTPTPDGGESGLLPQLGPDGLPLPGAGDGLSSTTGGATGEGDDVSIPLPLVPPIQLPPLLPGMPGVSIG